MSQRKPAAPLTPALEAAPLLADLRRLIKEARRSAAVAVNARLTLMYWRVGKRIRSEVLGDERAVYGETIVATLSRQLVSEYGRGFAEKNLRRMIQFAEAFPSEQIVVTLTRQFNCLQVHESPPRGFTLGTGRI